MGVHVSSVEIRDVLIPPELQDAMSMQAQAERERQVRVILGDSERQVAAKFEEAAKTYHNNPVALHLRAMNMLYEGLKEKATLVIVPSTVLNTMTLGDMTGTVSLAKVLSEPAEEKRPDDATPGRIQEVSEPRKNPDPFRMAVHFSTGNRTDNLKTTRGHHPLWFFAELHTIL
ncbi:MAG: SPFH domain-containing protein [Methanoregula sp.]